MIVKVQGENKQNKVLLYTLSTCAWCKRTKQFLKDQRIEYEFIDIDLCSDEELRQVKEDILRRGGSLVYPTIIVNNKILITGLQVDKIREVLKI